ncbi:MAG: cadherin repeat domain-containing protein [Cyclobacteriaceae bacterium]|nr:cadherin repeat domain-containing protein [Cyclobacteriaceae bacterium HetDA_MAG_MS6]
MTKILYLTYALTFLTLQFSAFAQDIYETNECQIGDGDLLTVGAKGFPEGTTFSAIPLEPGMDFDEGSGKLLWRPAADQSGEYFIQVSAEVNDSVRYRDFLRISVYEHPRAPSLEITATTHDLSSRIDLTERIDTFRVRLRAVDENINEHFRFFYEINGIPFYQFQGLKILNGGNEFEMLWVPTDQDADDQLYRFEILVEDKDGLEDTVSFSVVPRNKDFPPQILNTQRQFDIRPDKGVSFQVTAQDPDGDPIRYDFVNGDVPGSFSINPDRGLINVHVKREDVDTHLPHQIIVKAFNPTDPSQQDTINLDFRKTDINIEPYVVLAEDQMQIAEGTVDSLIFHIYDVNDSRGLTIVGADEWPPGFTHVVEGNKVKVTGAIDYDFLPGDDDVTVDLRFQAFDGEARSQMSSIKVTVKSAEDPELLRKSHDAFKQKANQFSSGISRKKKELREQYANRKTLHQRIGIAAVVVGGGAALWSGLRENRDKENNLDVFPLLALAGAGLSAIPTFTRGSGEYKELEGKYAGVNLEIDDILYSLDQDIRINGYGKSFKRKLYESEESLNRLVNMASQILDPEYADYMRKVNNRKQKKLRKKKAGRGRFTKIKPSSR